MSATPCPPVLSRPRSPGPALVIGLVLAVLAASLLVVLAPPSQARGRRGESRVISRTVVIKVKNTNNTGVICQADDDMHKIRAKVIGSRRDVYGRGGVTTANVMVHDAGTGSWFWTPPGQGRDNYARGLVRRHQISVVYNLLGYDGSRLANGDNTCLGAQAQILHQLVQALRAGAYRFAHDGHSPAAASHVAVHGHAQGALVAEIEEAAFDDVEGLVLMSWADSDRSDRDQQESQRELTQCLGATSHASFGAGRAAYVKLLFASATRSVRRTALRLRNRVPCGDVSSLMSAQMYAQNNNDQIEAKVLLLYGRRDVRLGKNPAKSQRDDYTRSPSVMVRRFRGTGSALPLEKKSPEVQRTASRWVARQVA